MSQINIVENKPALLIDVIIDNKSNKVLVVSDLHLGSTYWSQNNDIAFDWYHITTEIEAELRDTSSSAPAPRADMSMPYPVAPSSRTSSFASNRPS